MIALKIAIGERQYDENLVLVLGGLIFAFLFGAVLFYKSNRRYPVKLSKISKDK